MIKPYYHDDWVTIYNGDCLEVMKEMEPESINCCITSPPYWALRDYGAEPIIWDGDRNCEHSFEIRNHYTPPQSDKHTSGVIKGLEKKWKEGYCQKCGAWKGNLGLEPTFDLYIKHLCDIFDEVKRVLRKDGTCWVVIGDTYGGSGMGLSYSGFTKGPAAIDTRPLDMRPAIGHKRGVFDKCLLMIPFRFAIEMVNHGWILRNIIIWHKLNCMPASVKDRFTVDFEYIFFFVKNKKYWFEQQFEEFAYSTIPRMFRGVSKNNKWLDGPNGQSKHTMNQPRNNETKYFKEEYGGSGNGFKGHSGYKRANGKLLINPKGRNKRTVWQVPTTSFPEAHFAVYPEELIEPMIKAGCPEFICKKCEKPREKIYKSTTSFHSGSGKAGNIPKGKWEGKEQEISGDYDIRMGPVINREEIGFTDCGCNADFKLGLILDPFLGSGTTTFIARKLGKKSIGIDINSKYCDMAIKKLRQGVLDFSGVSND